MRCWEITIGGFQGERVRSAFEQNGIRVWKTMSAKSNGETAHSGSLAWRPVDTAQHINETIAKAPDGRDNALTHNPMFFRIFPACRCCLPGHTPVARSIFR